MQLNCWFGVKIIDVSDPLEGQNAAPCQICADRSRRCGDMAVFDFSRWRPSAILDF